MRHIWQILWYIGCLSSIIISVQSYCQPKQNIKAPLWYKGGHFINFEDISPDGKLIILYSSDGKHRLIEANTGNIICDLFNSISNGSNKVIFSNDSKSVFLISYSGYYYHGEERQNFDIYNVQLSDLSSQKVYGIYTVNDPVDYFIHKNYISVKGGSQKERYITRSSTPEVKYLGQGVYAKEQFVIAERKDSAGKWFELLYYEDDTSTLPIRIASDSANKWNDTINGHYLSSNGKIFITERLLYFGNNNQYFNRKYDVFDLRNSTFRYAYTITEDSTSSSGSNYGQIFDYRYLRPVGFTPDSKYIITRKDTTGFYFRSIDSASPTITLNLSEPADLYGFGANPDEIYCGFVDWKSRNLMRINTRTGKLTELTLSGKSKLLKNVNSLYTSQTSIVNLRNSDRIQLWDTKTGELQRNYRMFEKLRLSPPPNTNPPYGCLLGSNGTNMIIAGHSEILDTTIISNLTSDSSYSELEHTILSPFNHQLSYLSYSSSTNSMYFVDLIRDTVLFLSLMPLYESYSISRNGKFLVFYRTTTNNNGNVLEVKIFQTSDAKMLHITTIDSVPDNIRSVHISSDGSLLSIIGSSIMICDLFHNSIISTRNLYKDYYYGGRMSIDDKYIFFRYKDMIDVYDVGKDSIIRSYGLGISLHPGINEGQIYIETSPINLLDISDDDKYISCVTDDGSVACFENDLMTNSIRSSHNSRNNIVIFPVPSSDFITIKYSNCGRIVKESIIDVKGNSCYENNTITYGLSNHEIDIRALSNGVYLYIIQTDEGLFSQRFIVSRD